MSMSENRFSMTSRKLKVRRVATDEVRDISLLETAVAATVRDQADWDGKLDFSPAKEIDLASIKERIASVKQLFGSPLQTFDLQLHTGMQFLSPIYDRDWAVGNGMPWAHVEGFMAVQGSDGFSASGFGFYLEADDEGIVSIFPNGTRDGGWASFEDLPRLRSKAGAGVVVYDGSTLVLSRQPILWNVSAPTKFTGQDCSGNFGSIATPAYPGSFGTVPLAPVLAPIGPGRRLLIWFYLWHAGTNIGDSKFVAMLGSKVPLVAVSFGKGPIVK